MSKKPSKSQITTTEANSMLSDILTQYGLEMADGQDVIDGAGEIMSTTPTLDIALGGGIREGCVVQMASQTGAGKTTLSLEIAAKAQRKFKKQIVYIDAEGRLDARLLPCIKDLVWNEEQSKKTGIPCMLVIRSTKEKFLTSEDIFNLIRDLVKQGCFIILDSVAALVSAANYAGDIGTSEGGMLLVQKQLYVTLRILSQLMVSTKSTLIVITHLQNNPSGYGAALKVYGGKALEYFSSYRLIAYGSEEFPKEAEIKTGRMTTFQVLKTPLGTPSIKAPVFIRYGYGIDHERALCELAKTYGLLEQKGSWYVFVGSKNEEVKLQGIDRVCEHLRKNREDFAYLEKTITEMLSTNEIFNSDSGEVQGDKKD